jgi:hypothetical protein
MTVTAVIAAQQAAYTTAELTLAEGETAHYYASGYTPGDAPIQVHLKDAAGDFNAPMRYQNDTSQNTNGQMNYHNNFMELNGPLHYKLVKQATRGTVGVVRYT